MSRPPLVPGQMEFNLGTELLVSYPLTEFPAPDWDLKPFTPGDPKCPKCGKASLRTAYEKAGQVNTDRTCYRIFQAAPYELWTQVEFPEHLDRSCNVCGYAWTERTKEGSPDVEEDEQDE